MEMKSVAFVSQRNEYQPPSLQYLQPGFLFNFFFSFSCFPPLKFSIFLHIRKHLHNPIAEKGISGFTTIESFLFHCIFFISFFLSFFLICQNCLFVYYDSRKLLSGIFEKGIVAFSTIPPTGVSFHFFSFCFVKTLFLQLQCFYSSFLCQH